MGNQIKSGTLIVNGFETDLKTVRFEVSDKFERLYFVNRMTEEEIDVTYSQESSVVTIDLRNLKLLELTTKVIRFDLKTVVNDATHDVVVAGASEWPQWKRYFGPLANQENQGRTLNLYLQKSGAISMVYRKWLYANNERIMLFDAKLDVVSQTDNDISFQVLFSSELPHDVKITDANLEYRGNDQQFAFEKKSLEIVTDDVTRIKFTVSKDVIAATIVGDSYIISLRGVADNREVMFHVNEITEAFYEQLHKPYRDVWQITDEKKFLIQLALNGNLWIHYRDLKELDLPEVREREAEALTKYDSNLKNGNILMFEKESQMAQDNAFALFQYLQTTDLADKTFYVIDSDSEQAEKLQPWANQVLDLYSEEYFKHLIEDEMIVTSESLPHVYQFNMNSGNIIDILRTKMNFMLQHGVIGIRTLGGVFMKGNGGFDYFNSSTSREKELIESHLGYAEAEVPTLGLPRWDLLDNKQKSNTLVYFPTWREHLAYLDDDQFLESEYCLNIKNLIASKPLQKLLAENDYKLRVFLHPKMREFTGNFEGNEQIILTDSASESLSELIKTADGVISDYSSMVWDFAYQRKPIFLFQFDEKSYEEQLGGFFDKTIWDFGPSVHAVPELIDELSSAFIRGMEMDDVHEAAVVSQMGKLHDIREKHYQFIKENLIGGVTTDSVLNYEVLSAKYLEKYDEIYRQNYPLPVKKTHKVIQVLRKIKRRLSFK